MSRRGCRAIFISRNLPVWHPVINISSYWRWSSKVHQSTPTFASLLDITATSMLDVQPCIGPFSTSFLFPYNQAIICEFGDQFIGGRKRTDMHSNTWQPRRFWSAQQWRLRYLNRCLSGTVQRWYWIYHLWCCSNLTIICCVLATSSISSSLYRRFWPHADASSVTTNSLHSFQQVFCAMLNMNTVKNTLKPGVIWRMKQGTFTFIYGLTRNFDCGAYWKIALSLSPHMGRLSLWLSRHELFTVTKSAP